MSAVSQHGRRKAHVVVLKPEPEFDKRTTYEFLGRDAKGELIWWVRR